MLCIKSQFIVNLNCLPDYCRCPPLCGLHDAALLINETGYSCVGRTCNRTSCFYCTQPCIFAVLTITRSVFPPSVIGNNKYCLCTLLYIFSNIFSVNRFIADDRSNNGFITSENGRNFLCSQT